ncbi:hypothetical protein JCM10213_003171 [Rhodosporidiobolus nylandii]
MSGMSLPVNLAVTLTIPSPAFHFYIVAIVAKDVYKLRFNTTTKKFNNSVFPLCALKIMKNPRSLIKTSAAVSPFVLQSRRF